MILKYGSHIPISHFFLSSTLEMEVYSTLCYTQIWTMSLIWEGHEEKRINIDETPVYPPPAPGRLLYEFFSHFQHISREGTCNKSRQICIFSSMSTGHTSFLNTYRNRGTHEKIWWERPMYFPLNRTFPDAEGLHPSPPPLNQLPYSILFIQ